MGVFRSSNSFYDYQITDLVSYNLQSWLEYGLLETGAYTTVTRTNDRSDFATLERSFDQAYGGAGRVYEAMGPSFVWQSGVTPPSGFDNIFAVSGVHVNGTFYDKDTSGTYAHTIDYRYGRIIFDSSIPSGDTVKADYVFPDVAIYQSSDPEWKIIRDQYQSRFNELSSTQPSGLASTLKKNRVWLPSIVVNVEEREHRGLQLGGGEYSEIVAFLHIFSEQPFMRNALLDVINDQWFTTLTMFNIDDAPFPLNFDGSLSDSAVEYPTLADQSGQYFWAKALVEDARGRSMDDEFGIYRGEVRLNLDIERRRF